MNKKLKKLNYSIKKISANDTYKVRHPVLRAGKPFESCVFDGDNLDTTFHLGIYTDDQMIGICSFYKCNNDLLPEEFQYQLRGMAVLDNYQSIGLGKLLLSHGETLLKAQNTQIIWCNAREKAVNFYKKNGYSTIGTPFEIKEIGWHYMMYKLL
ncbi:MAG: GNAT superfamily N-acetyltransferase [Mariniflexile sp.]